MSKPPEVGLDKAERLRRERFERLRDKGLLSEEELQSLQNPALDPPFPYKAIPFDFSFFSSTVTD